MATIRTKNSVSSGLTPSGLTLGELAVNVTDKKLFVGNIVGGVVTLFDGNNIVTSVDGLTGSVTTSSASIPPLLLYSLGII